MKGHRRIRYIAYIAVSILLLVGLYIVSKGMIGGPSPGAPQSRNYRLMVSAPGHHDDMPVYKASQGDEVTLLITSTRSGEVNVHGYEKKIDLRPGSEVTLTFVAEEAGIFPLHLHEPASRQSSDGPAEHYHLATLEVQPR